MTAKNLEVVSEETCYVTHIWHKTAAGIQIRWIHPSWWRTRAQGHKVLFQLSASDCRNVYILSSLTTLA